MANCNPYPQNNCVQNTCVNTCVCIDPCYDNLGCIENKTECIIYNGSNLPNITVVTNENLNTILSHLSDKIQSLQDQITALTP